MGVTTLAQASVPLALLAAAVAGFFLKAYLEKRKSDRDDRKTDRESESGIVEATRDTLRIVREQMALMSMDMQVLRIQITELEARLRAKEKDAQALRSQVTKLKTRRHVQNANSGDQSKRRASMPRHRSSPPDVATDLHPQPGRRRPGERGHPRPERGKG